MITGKGIRYAFLYDYILKARKRLLKSPQILGCVTIFSYICSRIHKQIGGT